MTTQSVNVTIHVHNNGQEKSQMNVRNSLSTKQKLQNFADSVENQIAHNISKGEGLSSVLEKRYGLTARGR